MWGRRLAQDKEQKREPVIRWTVIPCELEEEDRAIMIKWNLKRTKQTSKLQVTEWLTLQQCGWVSFTLTQGIGTGRQFLESCIFLNKLSTNLYLGEIQVYVPTQKLLNNFECFQNQNTYIMNITSRIYKILSNISHMTTKIDNLSIYYCQYSDKNIKIILRTQPLKYYFLTRWQ